MKDKEYYIENASGELIKFSEEKLRQSLIKSGASLLITNEIINEIKKELKNGLAKYKIFQTAFKILRKKEKTSASKYKLKQGIMELGPSGFAFEKFISELYKAQGYQVTTGQVVKGKCVDHEIDVIAKKPNHLLLIECKYHNRLDIKCDIKVPLYIHSRFNDVNSFGEYKNFDGMLITNTSFSSDASTYAHCSGLKYMGWNEPKDKNLKNLIYELTLFPITCLMSLTKVEKELFISKNIVLIKQLRTNQQLLESTIRNSNRIKIINEEMDQVCS